MVEADATEEEFGFAGLDPWTKSARQMLGLMDTPAYLKRALRVQDATNALFKRCETQRSDWLEGVRLRSRHWCRLAHQDPALVGQLSREKRDALDRLNDELGINLGQSASNLSPGRPGRVWSDLLESVERFNQRWSRFIEALDCNRANQLIEGYNRYYLFEKECAFRSPRLASVGYRPLDKITPELLLTRYPLLPDLKLA